MIALLIEIAGPFAASYIIGKVGGKLGGSLIGRILLTAGRELSQQSAAETALGKLAATRKLTKAELSKLTQDERDAINHARGA